MKDLGDKVTSEERAKIEPILNELKTLIKGDNKDAIEAKTKELTELSGKIAEKAYAQSGAGAGSAADNASGSGSASDHANPDKKDDGVVDAEFEEVKDKDK